MWANSDEKTIGTKELEYTKKNALGSILISIQIPDSVVQILILLLYVSTNGNFRKYRKFKEKSRQHLKGFHLIAEDSLLFQK